MASSRWKRFAFFDRHTLNIPSDVFEDLIPSVKQSTTATNIDTQKQRNSTATDGESSSNAAAIDGQERIIGSSSARQEASLGNDAISLVVTTAALPLLSKPVASASTVSGQSLSTSTLSNSGTANDASHMTGLEAMWASLSTCSALPFEPNEGGVLPAPTIELPSQGQQGLVVSNKDPHQQQQHRLSTAVDGLVLCFVTSRHTPLVHCFDLSVRCNPPSSSNDSSGGSGFDGAARNKVERPRVALEDMDGWRGYFAPFPSQVIQQYQQQAPAVSAARRDGSRPTAPSTADLSPKRVVSISSCRCPDRHRPVHVACVTSNHLAVWEDPHLHLVYRRPLSTNAATIAPPSDSIIFTAAASSGFPQQQLWAEGEYTVVDILPGLVAIGTSTGAVLVYVYTYNNNGVRKSLRPYLRIPSPPGSGMEVVSIKLSQDQRKASAFVSYNRSSLQGGSNIGLTSSNTSSGMNQSTVGICCYEIPLSNAHTHNILSAPSARHDLDGRYVGSSNLVDSYSKPSSYDDSYNDGLRLTVARPDGLYSYSKSERTGVAPIDGTKRAICLIPPPIPVEKRREVKTDDDLGVGTGYVLVASTDSKSGRDAVDIYDITNNLVAFHLLLSPGHRAVRAAGVTTFPTSSNRNRTSNIRGGQSSAVVLTSGGSVVTLTEKRTEEKISLLVQKNLYSAAILVAYSDPAYEASEITSLYQTYAEYLYRKGDFSGAVEQYMHTIGSLESSHVIFRFLDAPKIPLLVKYLEKLRSLSLATPVHNDLLRTCYLKLNDTDAAEAIAVTTLSSQSSRITSSNSVALSSILSNLSTNPKEALAIVCSLEAPHAAEVLVVHGASLARAHPRETAGVVISICLGTFSPKALAEASIVNNPAALYKLLQYNSSAAVDHPKHCEPYPVQLFLPRTFVEHPKMLRLVLAHCNRNRCPLTPSLRRTLLELTLAEWNQAKRSGDTEAEKLRYREAIAALTDSHSRDIGDYDALVIVQLAGFEEGELLLYERLQMTPMLLERYAADGGEKARRRMLAMCQTDPEVLADVLSHFVAIASDKLKIGDENREGLSSTDDRTDNDEVEEIMEEIQECLSLAKRQGVLPPVRIARILAGEHCGQFSTDRSQQQENKKGRTTVPLSVALEYVGTILEESRTEISRLKSEVEEYNQLCNSMENEINSLLRVSNVLPPAPTSPLQSISDDVLSPPLSGNLIGRLSIDDLYATVRAADETDQFAERIIVSDAREAFWREMNQSEDSIETISRFFAKGVVN